jgi:molybdate transport system substrate-binding protein
MHRRHFLTFSGLVLTGCSIEPRKLTVAAAANLTAAFDQVGKAFKEESGIEPTFSYGPTAALAKQIENGAPMDVFAAADTEHVDQLLVGGHIAPGTRAIYAKGVLAMWAPEAKIRTLADLALPEVKFVAIAQPELAPYGRAAVEALQAAKLWEKVQPKVVYANSVSQARQMASTGNAEAALTAYSLVFKDAGTVLRVDAKLYAPIEQALGVVANSPHDEEARAFAAFVLGPRGKSILAQNGYAQ